MFNSVWLSLFFLMIPVRVCGKEGPLDLAFMLRDSDYDCHLELAKSCPECISLFQEGWPLNVTFLSGAENVSSAGFFFTYEFIWCNDDDRIAQITRKCSYLHCYSRFRKIIVNTVHVQLIYKCNIFMKISS